MKESIFLDYVGDNPRMRVLQYLIEGRNFDYTLTDLLNAGVSQGTLNNLLPKLLELGIVIKTRKIGRATLYKINQNNIIVKQLISLYDNLTLKKLNQIEEAKLEEISIKPDKKLGDAVRIIQRQEASKPPFVKDALKVNISPTSD